jgi:hypothetical protein
MKKAPIRCFFLAHLHSAFDFTGLETTCAHLHALHSSVYVDANGLNVREPTTPGFVLCMADQVAALRLFATNFTASCHLPHPLKTIDLDWLTLLLA